MSKKTYRDLKNDIEDLKNTLNARNGRIAVLCLAAVQKEEKILEYKGFIKTLETRLSNINTKTLAISNNVKHGTDYHPDDVAFKKTYKIPLHTETKYENPNKKCGCGKDGTIMFYGKTWCDDCFIDII